MNLAASQFLGQKPGSTYAEGMPKRSGPQSRTRRAVLRMLIGAGLGIATPSWAFADIPTIGKPPGRPRIRLDRLSFPEGVVGAPEYIRHLRQSLRQEAHRADWGAGRQSSISFRFVVEELALAHQAGALRVRCSARGELPRKRTARSRLVYSGDPNRGPELVRHVLTIVARGVVTRLADLERSRRQR